VQGRQGTQGTTGNISNYTLDGNFAINYTLTTQNVTIGTGKDFVAGNIISIINDLGGQLVATVNSYSGGVLNFTVDIVWNAGGSGVTTYTGISLWQLSGNPGTQGTQGTQGVQGRQGTQGTTGSQGTTGTQGTQGTQGITGGGTTLIAISFDSFTLGSTGSDQYGRVLTNDGINLQFSRLLAVGSGTFADWDISLSGEIGTQGVQGITGSQGTIGTTGTQGTIGTTGTQGTIGTTGAQGTQGVQGIQGVAGGGGGGLLTVEAKNSGYTILTTDLGKVFTCNASTAQTFNLPSVTTSHIGTEYTIVKLGAGKITVDAADSDTIEDSGIGDTIYCEDSGIATIKLLLVTETNWVITFANGTWITTD